MCENSVFQRHISDGAKRQNEEVNPSFEADDYSKATELKLLKKLFILGSVIK